MTKLLKIIGKIIGRSLEWLLILFIVFSFAIRFTPVQTFFAQQATNYLSKALGTTFKIDRLSVLFIDKIVLDGVYVEDQKGNKIADLGSIYVTFGYFSKLNNRLVFSEASIENGEINISRDPKDGTFNFQFIIDYFSSSKKKTSSKAIDIYFNKINLKRIHAKYNDNRKEQIPFGVDYNHVDAKNLYLTASNFKVVNGEISTFVKHISFKEQSGFNLMRLSSQILISPKGLIFDRLYISTTESKIYAPKLHFNITSFKDFRSFVDTVVFDAELKESEVSFKDISYFAPQLEGMDQIVTVQAIVTERIKDLSIQQFKFKTGNKTYLEGNFNLPDFRTLNTSKIDEKIDYAYLDIADLQSVKLPKSNSSQTLQLGEIVNRLKFFEVRNLALKGSYANFNIYANKINTSLGIARINNSLNVQKLEKSYAFTASQKEAYDITLEGFQLGELIQQSILGEVDGNFNVSGEILTTGVNIIAAEGKINRVDVNNYPYQNITINSASYIENVFEGDVRIADPNLKMDFDGKMSFGKQQAYDVDIAITEAYLNRLNILKSDSTVKLTGALVASISGTNINNYAGTIHLDSLNYKAGTQHFEIPLVLLTIDRSTEMDYFNVKSKIVNADFKGKIDITTIANQFNNQFSTVFPALITSKPLKKSALASKFEYFIEVQNLKDVLAIFVPGLYISNGSTFSGNFDQLEDNFSLDIQSKQITYNQFDLKNIQLKQTLNDSLLAANYWIGRFSMNDSLFIDSVHFVSNGANGALNSELTWNPNTNNDTKINWLTKVNAADDLDFIIQPSYFNIRAHKWEIPKETHISFAPKDIHFEDFLLSHEQQFISLNGAVSNDDTEQLLVRIHDLELLDFSNIIGLNSEIKGVANGNVTLSNPFENMSFEGDINVKGLNLNNQEVGDINVLGNWDKEKESINLTGDLIYKQEKTFTFNGDYFLKRDESLDFELIFDQTNIQFVNAFMDPKVVSNIKGLLAGKVHITGNPTGPKLDGMINMQGGNAKVAMFGVNFGFDGLIEVKENYIAMNNMPIFDEQGNMGYVNGTIYHTDFKDWNFDVGINLDEYWDPKSRSFVKVEPFLAMNTSYEEGAIYYGTAYATGRVNISGYTDNLDIEVDVKTEKNTLINFPLFGAEEVDDQLSFSWKSNDTTQVSLESKIDLSEVNLDLNFNVTPDATIKLIFDDNTNDEIIANGSGEISIKLDHQKDLKMDGTYTIQSGSYNFVFNPIKKRFLVDPGSTITWNGGGPTDANLKLNARYSLSTDINDISRELESQRSAGNMQPVDAKINLNGNLNAPVMNFELEAPKASESAKAAIQKINGDKDELNKQFFSLLLTNKFQSNYGTNAIGSNAALDALATQINGLLDQLSQDVRLNVGLKNNATTGSTSSTVGIKTNVLNDKLTITGSFGVENKAGGTNHNAFIGNLNLEYGIGKSDNLKINIFNESNDYNVIQDKNLGPFTQGVGIRYSESFDKISESKVMNFVLDMFRKDKHFKFTNKRRQTLLPEYSKEGTLPEEKTPADTIK